MQKKKVVYYFAQLFWWAFKADWGLKGKRKPRKAKSRETDRLLPSATAWYVYVLELIGGYYYVGKTRDIQRRTLEHFVSINAGAEWTRAHKAVRVLQVISVPESCLPPSVYENMVTKQHMIKFGIKSTRGGSYTCKNLNEHELFALEKEIADAKDECFRCGIAGHFANACPNRLPGAENTEDDGWC